MVGGIGLDERKLQLLLEPRDVIGVRRQVGELGILAGRLEILLRPPPLLGELVGAFELLKAPSDVGRLPMSVLYRLV